ncbi:MAG: hypothetical protein ACFHU9_07395 [Fluviicola sp.]
MKQITLFLIVFFLLVSCRKDKLEGGYEILQGKWKWVGSTFHDKNYSYATNTEYTTTTWIPATSESDDYFLEFEKKGKLAIWMNNREIKFYRLHTAHFMGPEESPYTTSVRIGLHLNYNNDKQFSCTINNDTLQVVCDYLKLPLPNYPIETPKSKDFFRHTYVLIN